MSDAALSSGASAPPTPEASTAAPAGGGRGLAIRLLVFVVAMGLVFLVATQWNAWSGGADVQSTDDAYIQSDITPLNARVAGYVRRVAVADFARVRAGDLIAELVDDDYRAIVAQNAAAVASAQAQIDTLTAQRALQEATLRAAQATVRANRATFDQSRRDAVRQRSLTVAGSGSEQARERADTTSVQSGAQLDQAQAQAEVAARQLRVLSGQIEQSRAALAGQEAALALARINLGRTRIVAPTAGVLGQKQVRAGQYVSVGGQLNTLTPLPDVWVIANYKETQLGHVAVGQPASIAVDMYPGITLRGHVVGFAPASGSQFALLPPDNASGNFTKIVQRIAVKIAIDNPNAMAGRLRPGMSVVAQIDTRGHPSEAQR